MASFVGSRLLGLVRDIAIGQTFGTSADLDAYLAAFRVPDTLFQLLAGAAMGSAFIPVFAGYLARHEESEGWLLANSVINAVLALTSIAALLAAVFTPTLMGWIAPGFADNPAQFALTVELTQIMLITPVIFGASGLFMAILNARQHFLWPAVAPMTYNLAITLAALLFGAHFGVRALAVGAVVGAVAHLLVQVPELVRHGLRYVPVIAWRQPGFRQVLLLMGPRIVGLAAAQLNLLVTTMLASQLQEGSLAALNYAYLVMMAPLGVFGMAISTAAFPTMAERAAREEYDALRAMLAEALRLILFLTVPAMVFLMVEASPVVGVLFQRGRFDDLSRAMTASALPFYALGLAGHATIEISTRVFYAFHDTRTPVALSLGSMVAYVVLGSWLRGPLGLAGLALGLSLTASLEGILLLALARRRLGSVEERQLIAAVRQIGLSAIGLAAVCAIGVGLGARLAGEGIGAWAIALAIGAGLGGPVYLGVAWISGSRELRTLVDQVARRIGGLIGR